MKLRKMSIQWHQSKHKIILITLLIHAVCIAFCAIDHLLHKKELRKRAMIVRTMQLPAVSAPIPTKTPLTTHKKQNNTTQKTKEAAKPKKQSSLAHISHTNASKDGQNITADFANRKPVNMKIHINNERLTKNCSDLPQEREKRGLDHELIQELEKSISLLSSPQSSKSVPLSLPKPITLKAQMETQNEHSPSYAEKLTSFLTNALILPELGKVKVRLQVNQEGRVVNLNILETESRKNSEFLKNQLPQLPFPCFNEFGLAESQLEFTITFQNH